jgi:hypothetical protein
MIRIIAILTVLLGMGLESYAQNEADVQRLSSKYFFGTARYTGLGGAMGALGGDMSAIHVNPAGIGIYRYGALSFTPSLELNAIDGNLNGRSSSDLKTKLAINNAGFVLANELDNPDWRMLNIGVSYTRLNTYNDIFTLQSTNPKEQSLIRDLRNQAEGLFPDELSDFNTGLAYDVFIIDNPDSLNPTNYVENGGNGDINQVQTAERDGRLSETAISVGTNYKDILFLGLTLGFQSLVYEQKVETRESPASMTDTDLRNYNLTENLEISGLGLNFKLGAMVKAGKYVRFGGSIQTPTTFSLTDEFRNSISASYVNPVETLNSESQLGNFEYRIKTPWRYMVSAAGLLGRKGLVSIQYEYTDFSNGELKDARNGNDANFSRANDLINDQFSASNILRAGAEYRFTDKFYSRAGVAYFSNPITGNEGLGADLDRMQYAGGFGYRSASWNIDLSYQWTQFEEVYKTNNSANIAVLENQLQSITLTAGLRL